MRHPHHYDPNQPRIPAGQRGGGRWTEGGYKTDTILQGGGADDRYRQDTILQSPPQAEDGDGQDTRVQLAFLRGGLRPFRRNTPGDIARQKALELERQKALERARKEAAEAAREKAIRHGLALFSALSALNSADRRAVIAFKAQEYHADGSGKLILESLRLLNRDQVSEVCKQLVEVQKLTDAGAASVQENSPFLTPSAYGTAVHSHVERKINKPGGTTEPGNPDFMAEASFLKTREETGETLEKQYETRDGHIVEVHRGQKGSIRVDVFEKVDDKNVCVYDIKTGKRRLSDARIREIAAAVAKRYGTTVRFIVIEVRPIHPRALRPR